MNRLTFAILVAIFSFSPVCAQTASDEVVDLFSFGHRVQACLHEGALTWLYPGIGDSPAGEGKVDWKGPAPTGARQIKVLSLPSGEKGIALVARSPVGIEGLYLLREVWGGAELWGGGPWLEAEAGESISGYEFNTTSSCTTGWLWSSKGIATRYIADGQDIRDRADLEDNTSLVLRSYRNSGTPGPSWTLVAALRNEEGWRPLVWTFTGGSLGAFAHPDTALSPGQSQVSVALSRGPDSRLSVFLLAEKDAALWTWLGTQPRDPFPMAFAERPEGYRLGGDGKAGLFYWRTSGGLAGAVTASLGNLSPQAWQADLVGAPLFVSDAYVITGGFRLWTVVKSAGATQVWRVEVGSDERVRREYAGDLASETESVSLLPSKDGLLFIDLLTKRTWRIESETLQVVEEKEDSLTPQISREER